MNNKMLQPVRGTHDYYGDDMVLMRHIINVAQTMAQNYGFSEMQTPIFEFADVFHRSLGETSDVVSKETYSFADRGGEMLTLRPEFTAAIVRAFISGGYTQQLPFKAFYAGAAFRYERPQKGRMRQFHQIGVECLGAKSPWQDCEIIACADAILTKLLGRENIALELNTLGDIESRNNYREILVEYFNDYKAQLSPESLVRLEKNPLRILDSKQEADKAIVANAPIFSDYLSGQAQDWFANVRAGLDALQIPHIISPRLVRGLDYYTHSVFEFTTTELGAQATILAGGRYNGLVAQLGGGDIAGVGFAAGIERIMILLQQKNWVAPQMQAKIALFTTDAKHELDLLQIANNWRKGGVACEILISNNFSKAIKKAETIKATHLVEYGEAEKLNAQIKMRNLRTRIDSEYFDVNELPKFIV
jgi:histidyl-tRNA synthetase